MNTRMRHVGAMIVLVSPGGWPWVEAKGVPHSLQNLES